MPKTRSFCAAAAVLCAAMTATAQQPPAEEPGWAKGRPKTEAAQRMAPVPAFPIPTSPDKLPTAKVKLPPYVPDHPIAREDMAKYLDEVTNFDRLVGLILAQLEADGLVIRTVYPQVPPKVDYRLTEWGQALCPVLDAMLTWAEPGEAPPSVAPPRGAVSR